MHKPTLHCNAKTQSFISQIYFFITITVVLIFSKTFYHYILFHHRDTSNKSIFFSLSGLMNVSFFHIQRFFLSITSGLLKTIKNQKCVSNSILFVRGSWQGLNLSSRVMLEYCAENEILTSTWSWYTLFTTGLYITGNYTVTCCKQDCLELDMAE